MDEREAADEASFAQDDMREFLRRFSELGKRIAYQDGYTMEEHIELLELLTDYENWRSYRG